MGKITQAIAHMMLSVGYALECFHVDQLAVSIVLTVAYSAVAASYLWDAVRSVDDRGQLSAGEEASEASEATCGSPNSGTAR